MRRILPGLVCLFLVGAGEQPTAKQGSQKAEAAPEGWTTAAPRDEIRPNFSYEPAGGRDGKGIFRITADKREGLDGFWTRTYPITGGRSYRFQALRKATNVAVPRRSAVVRILWQDDAGKKVPKAVSASS